MNVQKRFLFLILIMTSVSLVVVGIAIYVLYGVAIDEGRERLAEIRAPFAGAGIVAGISALLVVLLGAVLFLRISNPMIRRLQEYSERMEEQVEERTAELRTVNERFRQLFNEAPVMYVITHDQEGVPIVSDCNRLFLSTLNYTHVEEVVDRPLADFYTPESRAELLEQGGYQRALAGRFGDQERQLLTREGNVVETLLRAVPETDSDESTSGTRAMYVDITERKRTEEETIRLREELAHVTRVATVGELTASLAHEINQPLAAILSNAQAAQRFLSGDTPDLDEVRDALEDIVEDDSRASEVIRRVRALLRGTEVERTVLDINEVVREVVSVLRSEAVVKGGVVRLELSPDLRPVLADRIQLQQVVLNLMRNGMEAMSGMASESRVLILRTSTASTDGIEVAVQDSGVGFDEGEVDRIFEPFYTTKAGGMGVGLSISRSIIEGYGGRLWATNNPEGGATLRFSLPVCKGDEL